MSLCKRPASHGQLILNSCGFLVGSFILGQGGYGMNRGERLRRASVFFLGVSIILTCSAPSVSPASQGSNPLVTDAVTSSWNEGNAQHAAASVNGSTIVSVVLGVLGSAGTTVALVYR